MLLELPSLSQIPGADRVVQPSGPQFGPIVGDVDTAGSVCVALELPEITQNATHQVRNRGESPPKFNNNGVYYLIHQTQRTAYEGITVASKALT